MQRSSGARFLPMILTLIVIIVAVVLVVSIGRALFFSGDKKDNTTSQTRDIGKDALLNTEAGRSVRLTVRGPIVAEENFKSYTIEVSATSRSMSVYKGYLDSLETNKNYANNQKAYEQFVYALDKANMMKGSTSDEDTSDDLRGICATGYVYEYSVLQGSQVAKRLWTSTCGGSKGTLDASISQLNNLYQQQVPDYDDLVPFKQSPLNGLQF